MSGRRRQGAQVANLDSLLDTMANVTGILIVLLAVTQLSVSDAMDRIRNELAQRPELTGAALRLAEFESERLANALAPLQARRDQLVRTLHTGRQELATLRSENEKAREGIGVALRFPGSIESLNSALELSPEKEKRLEQRIGKARREIAVLDRDLASIKRPSQRTEITLPDPRPTPPGAEQVPVFVRYGKVVPVDVGDLVGRLRRATLQASEGKWAYGEGPPNFVDRSQIVAHFQSHDVGTKDFRWHIVNNGGREFFAHLEWRNPDEGDSLRDLSSGRSHLARELQRLSPRSHFFSFFVWEDSFESYLVARELTTQAGFTSGWRPYGEHDPLRQWLLATSFNTSVD
jgi:hypothetical protein